MREARARLELQAALTYTRPAMLTVSEVTKAYGGKTLFEDVSTTFDPGNRYGLTGANGAGKSTFMKILSGDVEPDKGHISLPNNARMSVLHQDHFRFAEFKVRDVVIMGNDILWKALEEKEKMLAEFGYDNLSEEDGMRLGELEMVVAEERRLRGGEATRRRILDRAGDPDRRRCTTEPARGALRAGCACGSSWRRRCSAIPTSSCWTSPRTTWIMDSIRWLEEFLHEYSGVLLVVISHDRHFLNRGLHPHRGHRLREHHHVPRRVRRDAPAEGRLPHSAEEKAQSAASQKKISDLRDFIQPLRGQRQEGLPGVELAASARSRSHSSVSMTDLKRSNIQRPFIRFEIDQGPSGKLVLEVDRLTKSFEGETVFTDVSFTLTRGDKLAVVGPNGVGKTTLLKCLAGVYEPDRGKFRLGHEVSVGYMPQDHEEGLQNAAGKTAYEWLHQWDPKATVEEVRGLLGRMLFPSEDAEKPVSALSGGETVRLLMSKLTLTKDNLLLLDEPNNHLDLESIRALEESLVRYEGTLIFVVHDQAVLEEVATCVLELRPDGSWDFFPGGYEDFLRKTGKN